MRKPPVLALWLDAAEPDLLERLLEAGRLPHLRRLRAGGAYARLHSIRFGVTEVSYAMLGTGCWPSTLGYWQQCAFDKTTYSGRLATLEHFDRHRPFYALGPDHGVVVFDVPQMPLRDDARGLQVTAWGSHAPHVPRASRPAGLLGELLARHPVPQMERQSGYQVEDADSLRGIHQALRDGLARRGAVLADLWRRAPAGRPWDLFFAAVAETHTAGHAFWPHPDMQAAVDEAGAEALLHDVYREVDALVGRLLAEVGPDAQVLIFSVEGMRRNDMDNGSMLFLPDLLLRHSFPGRRAFDFGAPAAHEPPAEGLDGWYDHVWRHRVRPGPLGAWLRRRLDPARAAAWEVRLGLRPAPYLARPGEERYLPCSWLWPYLPYMQAFALPGFSDGFVRVNVRGRERDGRVPARAFGRVCDELTGILCELVDGHGRAVVDEVIRTREDPHDEGPARPPADLVVRWSPHCGREAFSPRLGRLGPVPPMRLGNHSPDGFVLARGPGFAPGATLADGRVVDLAPTVWAMVGAPAPPMDGRPLLDAAVRAPGARSVVLGDPAQPPLFPARLAVVLCVRDEEDFILANLLYHRALGVEQAYVYLDRCTDRTAELAGSLRGVRLFTVSPAERGRYAYVGDLQAACMTHALGLARRDGVTWLLALDPDEFASGLDRDAAPPGEGLVAACDLRRLVAHLPPEPLQVVLAPRECVPADLGDAPFWRQAYFQSRPIPRRLHDPVTGETIVWDRFLGHDTGKALLRTTANVTGYHPHRWVRPQAKAAAPGRGPARRLVDDSPATVTAGSLYHFNVVSAAHWQAKFRKSASDPPFWPSGHRVEPPRECWRRASGALDPGAAARYFARWIALSADELEAHQAAGRLSVDRTVETVLRATGCLEADRVRVPPDQRAAAPARPEPVTLAPAAPSPRPRRLLPDRDRLRRTLRQAVVSDRGVHRVFPADVARTELRGFHPVEASGGEGFCWTMPRARIRLGVPPGAYELAVHTRHLAALWSGELRAFLGERALEALGPLDAAGTMRFHVDAAAFPAEGDAWLRLEASPVDTAAWPGEWRALGVPIFELAFTPAPRRARRPAPAT
jgi:predicted AlkP superfamily phosphohydrolase/phosphomutase